MLAGSSTLRNRTLAPGLPWASWAERASPATPPPHPKPKIGNRSTVGRKSMRFMSMASRLGTASPVMVLTTMKSISAGTRPASAIALVATSSRRTSASRW